MTKRRKLIDVREQKLAALRTARLDIGEELTSELRVEMELEERKLVEEIAALRWWCARQCSKRRITVLRTSFASRGAACRAAILVWRLSRQSKVRASRGHLAAGTVSTN